MELTNFPESNVVLDKPGDMTHDQCESACACRTHQEDGTPVVITCWKVTQAELEEIQRTGRVWLVIAGHTMPPAAMMGTSPFGK